MTAIFRNTLASCGVAICLFAIMAAPPAQAQVPSVSLLPTAAQVPPGTPLPIDGVWRVRENGKRVRIDRGRSIDIDPWVQAFVFRVDPGRVTMKDIHPDGSGGYTGYDLVLLQQVDMHLEPDGSITAIGSGISPATFHLDRLSPAAGGVPAMPPAYAPPPGYSPAAGAPPAYSPPAYSPPADAPPTYAPPAGAPPTYAPPAAAPPGYGSPSAGTPPAGNGEPTVNPWSN